MWENPGKKRTRITPNTPYLSVFSTNAVKSGKNADQNNFQYGIFFTQCMVLQSETILFADDSVLYTSGSSQEETEHKSNKDILSSMIIFKKTTLSQYWKRQNRSNDSYLGTHVHQTVYLNDHFENRSEKTALFVISNHDCSFGLIQLCCEFELC